MAKVSKGNGLTHKKARTFITSGLFIMKVVLLV